MKAYKTISCKSYDCIRLVTLRGKGKLHTLPFAFFDELADLLDEVEQDAVARAVVIYGDETSFCAGVDLNDSGNLTGGESEYKELLAGLHRTYQKLCDLKKPTIAAAAGYTLGGGLELALCCDFIAASENARFGLPEAKLGGMPCIGGTQRLPRRIGSARAKELMFTCDFLNAQQALEIGLVNHVYPAERLLENALALAERISMQGPLGLAAIKECVNKGLDGPLATGIEIEILNMAKISSSEDLSEGIRAYAEKRQPSFAGR